jgi:serine/threonine protein kinase
MQAMEVSSQDPALKGRSTALSHCPHATPDTPTSQIKQSTPERTAAASNSSQSVTDVHDFDFISLIGRGNSSEVKLVENKVSTKLYAIKSFQKQRLLENDETKIATIERHILNISTEENHPFIVKFYGAFQTQTDLGLIMEYVSGGNLMWHLQQGPFLPERAQ